MWESLCVCMRYMCVKPRTSVRLGAVVRFSPVVDERSRVCVIKGRRAAGECTRLCMFGPRAEHPSPR